MIRTKSGGVEDGLPEGGGGQDRFAAKEEKEDVGAGAHKGVDDRIVEACGRHGWADTNKAIELLVEIWRDGQCRECLGRALRKADKGRCLGLGHFQNIVDAVGNVVHGKLVHGKVPEGGRVRGIKEVLFRVLVAAVVAQLKTLLAWPETAGMRSDSPKRRSPDPPAGTASTFAGPPSIPTLHCSS